jgi:hypothetical protein
MDFKHLFTCEDPEAQFLLVRPPALDIVDAILKVSLSQPWRVSGSRERT